MFVNNLYADGRMSVSGDGTLRIQGVTPGDAGEYTCKAISSKGKEETTAVLVVRGGSKSSTSCMAYFILDFSWSLGVVINLKKKKTYLWNIEQDSE